MSLRIPVSVGELFDKFSILKIKFNKITDISKQQLVLKELELLKPYLQPYNLDTKIYEKLKTVNNELWIIEDQLRIKESIQEFDQEFIQLARKVYLTNDKRATIKKNINIQFQSEIIEVKNYMNYK